MSDTSPPSTPDSSSDNSQQKKEVKILRLTSGRIGDQHVEAVLGGFLVNNNGRVWLKHVIIDQATDENERLITIHWYPEKQEPYLPYEVSEMYTELDPLPIIDAIELFNEVYRVFDDFLDIPSEYKRLFTVATFFSYIQDKSKTTPYLFFGGEKGTGKSRALELLEYLAYRAMMATSISGPNVFQYLEGGPKTILDDEVKESVERDPDKRAIYLTGYRSSGKAPRIIIDKDGKRKQVFYPTYSFKGFNSVDKPKVPTFMDRCIPIGMVKGTPRFGGFINEDIERFKSIRNKLLIWRMQVLAAGTEFPQVRPRNRTDELFLPLLNTTQIIGVGAVIPIITRIRDAHQIEQEQTLRETLALR